MTYEHKKALKLYLKFVIRDELNIVELKEFRDYINETIKELRG